MREGTGAKSYSREWDRILCRLRIGHTNITHKYLMERGEPPTCEYCDEPLNVAHLLLDCPAYENERNLRFPNTERNLRNLLIKGDTSLNGALYNFIRNTGLFRQI